MLALHASQLMSGLAGRHGWLARVAHACRLSAEGRMDGSLAGCLPACLPGTGS